MATTLEAVSKADVIVTNPTHFAVALAYEMGTDEAPKVIAKGADFMARKIREKARLWYSYIRRATASKSTVFHYRG